jgi:hypothetical protein
MLRREKSDREIRCIIGVGDAQLVLYTIVIKDTP